MIAKRLLQISAGVLLGLVVVLLALGQQRRGSDSGAFTGTVVAGAGPAPDFTLTTHDGDPFRLADQTGRVTVLFFGFSHCPDVCPATLARLAAAVEELGADRDRVQVAMITVDPERDTRERLEEWVTGFDPSFVGLRGEEEVLRQVASAYGVHYEAVGPQAHEEEHDSGAGGEAATLRRGGGAYDVIHSGRAFVVDPQGRLVLSFGPGLPAREMAADLARLIR